jgi:hypothetical protein
MDRAQTTERRIDFAEWLKAYIDHLNQISGSRPMQKQAPDRQQSLPKR